MCTSGPSTDLQGIDNPVGAGEEAFGWRDDWRYRLWRQVSQRLPVRRSKRRCPSNPLAAATQAGEPWQIVDVDLDTSEGIRVLVVHDMEGLSGPHGIFAGHVRAATRATGCGGHLRRVLDATDRSLARRRVRALAAAWGSRRHRPAPVPRISVAWRCDVGGPLIVALIVVGMRSRKVW